MREWGGRGSESQKWSEDLVRNEEQQLEKRLEN